MFAHSCRITEGLSDHLCIDFANYKKIFLYISKNNHENKCNHHHQSYDEGRTIVFLLKWIGLDSLQQVVAYIMTYLLSVFGHENVSMLVNNMHVCVGVCVHILQEAG